MKYYDLSGIINSKPFHVHKHFATREAAIDYAFRLLPSNVSIEEEIEKEKHVVEYKCTENTRFLVARQSL